MPAHTPYYSDKNLSNNGLTYADRNITDFNRESIEPS